MAVINEIIPESNISIVRDSIVHILTEEINNQIKIQNLQRCVEIWSERSNSFNQSEELMINVTYDSSSYADFTESHSAANNVYFVDVVTSSRENNENRGGLNSANLRDKYLSMIRYILSSHKLNDLMLPQGLILGTYVNNIETFEHKNNQDSSFIKMARLTFSVRFNECQSDWEGVNINSIFTTTKLDLTDLGYKCEINLNN